jgi:glycosyltransferase involved in cell wall biosynthesis
VLLLGNPSAEYRRELETTIASLGLAGRVIFHPAVQQTDLPSYYTAADAACWPRGVSIATLEVSACALPLVIAAQTLPERVSHGNGLEYQEGNVADLARCLTQQAQNPAQAHQMGKRGRQMVEQNHCWSKINQQFMSAYQTTHLCKK